MFNLQGGEIVIILLLALVVLGPEKLPDAMRRAGQFYAELKKMSSSFQSEFRSVIDEPMREVRNTADMLRDSADFTKLSTGGRDEKPKSAEMVAPRDAAAAEPTEQVPFTPDAPVPEQLRDSASDASGPAPSDTTQDASPDAPPDASARSDADAPADPTVDPDAGGAAEPAADPAPVEAPFGTPRPFASSHQRWSFDTRPPVADEAAAADGAAADQAVRTDDPEAGAEGRTE